MTGDLGYSMPLGRSVQYMKGAKAGEYTPYALRKIPQVTAINVL